MERREAVRNMALALGIAVSAPTMSALFSSCRSENKEKGIALTIEDESLIAEIADTILPATNTPGAKAAGVGPFVAMMVKDCYTADDQRKFSKGLRKIDRLSERKFKKKFTELSVPEKNALIKQLAEDTVKYRKEQEELKSSELKNVDFRGIDAADKEAKVEDDKDDRSESHFFPIMHELTLLGYFTSEIGATQALEYIPIPAKFESCVDMKPGQKSWAI